MNAPEFFGFVLLSLALLWFTLRRPHAHRGYRFVAFEAILTLVFLQADRWFIDPLRPVQLLSWIALAVSLGLALHGFYLLRTQGAPNQDIENTTLLVTTGAYRYIRHPLYASLLLFGIGAALKQLSPLVAALVLILILAVYATAKVEERSNLERFGDTYRDYMSHTRMFIPYLL